MEGASQRAPGHHTGQRPLLGISEEFTKMPQKSQRSEVCLTEGNPPLQRDLYTARLDEGDFALFLHPFSSFLVPPPLRRT